MESYASVLSEVSSQHGACLIRSLPQGDMVRRTRMPVALSFCDRWCLCDAGMQVCVCEGHKTCLYFA